MVTVCESLSLNCNLKISDLNWANKKLHPEFSPSRPPMPFFTSVYFVRAEKDHVIEPRDLRWPCFSLYLTLGKHWSRGSFKFGITRRRRKTGLNVTLNPLLFIRTKVRRAIAIVKGTSWPKTNLSILKSNFLLHNWTCRLSYEPSRCFTMFALCQELWGIEDPLSSINLRVRNQSQNDLTSNALSSPHRIKPHQYNLTIFPPEHSGAIIWRSSGSYRLILCLRMVTIWHRLDRLHTILTGLLGWNPSPLIWWNIDRLHICGFERGICTVLLTPRLSSKSGVTHTGLNHVLKEWKKKNDFKLRCSSAIIMELFDFVRWFFLSVGMAWNDSAIVRQ